MDTKEVPGEAGPLFEQSVMMFATVFTIGGMIATFLLSRMMTLLIVLYFSN